MKYMKQIKHILAWMLAVTAVFTLIACGSSGSAGTDAAEETAAAAESETSTETSVPVTAERTSGETGKTLVVYFSATGTTKGVAEKIAALTGAEIQEIVPAEPYTAEDLNYNDHSTRATVEQNTPDARPEIADGVMDLSGYDVIYVGYPIWWGEEPRIMDTFVETNDFGSATVIPFCTSGGSGVGRSDKNLADNAGSGTWKSGQRFSGSVSDDDLQAWIDANK